MHPSDTFPTTVALMGYHVCPDSIALNDVLTDAVPSIPLRLRERLMDLARAEWRTEKQQCFTPDQILIAHEGAICEHLHEDACPMMGVLQTCAAQLNQRITMRVRSAAVLNLGARMDLAWRNLLAGLPGWDRVYQHADSAAQLGQGTGVLERHIVTDIIARDLSVNYREIPRLSSMLERHALHQVRVPLWLGETVNDQFGIYAQHAVTVRKTLIERHGYCDICVEYAINVALRIDQPGGLA